MNRAKKDFLVLLLFWVAISVGALLTHAFSYNRWDNFELGTPNLLEAHGRWLKAEVPLWSAKQHLGEALLESSQSGVFYFPYTIAVAIAQALHAPGQLLLIVALFHLSFGFFGWLRLFDQFNVHPLIGYAAAISILGGGFVSLMIPVWSLVGGFLCWLPWALYGGVVLMHAAPDRRVLWLPLATTMAGHLGYPQFYIYLWLAVGLFLILWAPRHTGRLAIPCAVSLLLSAPSLLPVYMHSKSTLRAVALPLADFLQRSALPSHCLSLFLPTIKTYSYYFPQEGTLTFFQGAWLPVAVIGALLFFRQRVIVCATAVAVFFGLLSLGRFGLLYPLTHGLPVWSSFRWPFKFLLFANALFALAAALAAEAWRRQSGPSRGWIAYALSAGLMIVWVWGGQGISSGVVTICFVVVALVALVCLLYVARPAGRVGLVLSALVTTTLVQILVHTSPVKQYDEPLGHYDRALFGFAQGYRVLPVSAPAGKFLMQPLGLYQAASLNDYDSATGCTTAMIPRWYRQWLPSDESGLLPEKTLDRLLGSHFLKAINVKYVIAANDDNAHRAFLQKRGFTLKTQLAAVSVFEQSGVLPRLYFASELRPLAAMEEGLVGNKADIRAAFVPEQVRLQKMPEAQVFNIQFLDSGIAADMIAPDGGLLVFSSTYYPGWRVLVDGNRTTPFIVNGLVVGAHIPPQAKHVRFIYTSSALGLAWLFFAGGALILGIWLVGFKSYNPNLHGPIV